MRLTGWPRDEGVGRPLVEVFQIINEHAGQPVETRALVLWKWELQVMGLANHTVLIARDGRSGLSTTQALADSR